MFNGIISDVREKAPLIHNITNYVTVNDVANAILACGASPIMADEPAEVADIQTICGGLNLNIGTLHKASIDAMLTAGKTAKRLGHPVLLDPVGAGASHLRTQTAIDILDIIKPDIVRGNVSEIKTLAAGCGLSAAASWRSREATTGPAGEIGTTKGVDADAADAVTAENLPQMVRFVKDFAQKAHAVVAITGAIDLVADGETCYVIRNGVPGMSRITGTGCMLSGIMTAFVTARPAQKLSAAAAAVAAMGLAGEIGASHLAPYEGNAALRSRIIDAISLMDDATLEKGAKIEKR